MMTQLAPTLSNEPTVWRKGVRHTARVVIYKYARSQIDSIDQHKSQLWPGGMRVQVRKILEVSSSRHARAWLLIFIFASAVSGRGAFFHVGLLFAGTPQWLHTMAS
jgi:hypothetical protein